MQDHGFPEFRTDVLTGQRILLAPSRSLRPSSAPPDPALDLTDDPFAEGREAETPRERFALRPQDSVPDGPGWSLRVVPNRYPAVVPRSQSAVKRQSVDGAAFNFFPFQSAFGEHDVVIECPDSRSRLVELSVAEVQQIFAAWRTRLQQLSDSGVCSSVAVFRNEGFSAGASLGHCHSQIIASEQMTTLDLERHRRANEYRHRTGQDLVLALLQAERNDGRRVVVQTDGFVVLCPFAPCVPWQVRIVPDASQPESFTCASDAALSELAELVRHSLLSLETALQGSFSFNLTLPHPRLDQPAAFSWMLDILPRTSRSAGWEYLTNVEMITVSPESSAAVLRSLMGRCC